MAFAVRSCDLPPFARGNRGPACHSSERRSYTSTTTASHDANPYFSESQSRRPECDADDVSPHEDVDRMIRYASDRSSHMEGSYGSFASDKSDHSELPTQASTSHFKSEADINAEFEAMITEIKFKLDAPHSMGLPALLGKDALGNHEPESFKESFTERVLREQMNLEHLNNIAAKSASALEPQKLTYEMVIVGSKVTEAAVNSAAARVRAKLDAVKQMRMSFLDG